jgi:hypothetical protein
LTINILIDAAQQAKDKKHFKTARIVILEEQPGGFRNTTPQMTFEPFNGFSRATYQINGSSISYETMPIFRNNTTTLNAYHKPVNTV